MKREHLASALGRQRVTAGLVRVGPLAAIPDLLEESAVDADEVLADYGLTRDYFREPENVMSFASAGRLLVQAAERTGIDHFGLLVGQRAGASSLGTIAYLVRSAPDVATALRMLAGHIQIQDGGAVVTLTAEDGYASLGYAILAPSVDGSDQIYDASMAVGLKLMRELCGSAFGLAAVNLARARPDDAATYRRVFGLMPAFDAEASTLVFSDEWLRLPLATADPVLHRLMTDWATRAAAVASEDVVGRLKRLLRPIVGGSECTLPFVAALMSLPARTLNRRLAEEGVTFRGVREEVRLEVAQHLLLHTRRAAYEIADTLGYSDATAFTRAFRRRHGAGPAAWRKAARRVGTPP